MFNSEPSSHTHTTNGYASSHASSSTSSVENSPTMDTRVWPTPSLPADVDLGHSAVADDLSTYFALVMQAADRQSASDHSADDRTTSEFKSISGHSSRDLSLCSDSENDMNRKVSVTTPSGHVSSNVVCPFNDSVHYALPIDMHTYTSEQLSDSDTVFSKDFAELSFVCRVLSMAMDPNVPLLDRFKFICIVSYNLDEHFSKRLGHIPKLDPRDLERATINLKRQVRPRTKYEEDLSAALSCVVRKQHECLKEELLPKLASHGVEIVPHSKLSKTEMNKMTAYFKERLRPGLTPLMLDQTHPFPLIRSHDIYLLVSLYNPKERTQRNVLFRTPPGERLIPLDDSGLRFVTSEDVCLANLSLLCHSMVVRTAHAFRVTRNTKIQIEDESFADMDNLLDYVIDEVHRRRQAPTTRLEVLPSVPRNIVDMLVEELNLDDIDVYVVDSPVLDLSTCMPLAFVPLPWLRHTTKDPVVPSAFKGLTERLRTDPGAIFGVLSERDVLVEYPRDNFEHSAILFLHAAARDPRVQSIKTVLYRGGSNSPIIAALVRAAKNGKEVSVIIELKASFDEVENSEYARSLQLAGCNVTYGVVGLKVHSKIMLVVREEPNGSLTSYVNVATGNFNPKTARLYTDCSLFTCRKDVCTDVLDVFNILTGYSLKNDFRTLLVAPMNMLERFIEMIREEANNAKAGIPARIACQMNGLSDKAISKELYDASQAGVRIDLIVRGACRVIPGIPGKSDNIRVYSWVGQVLQHRRIYYFHAGGNGRYFIGSADWRTRNLTGRMEVIVPIEDRTIRKRLSRSFDLITDKERVWRMAPDGRYYKGLPAGNSPPVSISIAPAPTVPVKEVGASRRSKSQPPNKFPGHGAYSPRNALVDAMVDDEEDKDLAGIGDLPTSISESESPEVPMPTRPKPSKRRFQVNIKGATQEVDKLAVGAVPIQFRNGMVDREHMEILMVARGDDDLWAVPKGGKNEGESDQMATIRIAREKAGVSSCENIANLGWIELKKTYKRVAVQTFVLLAKGLGPFVSSKHDRRRTWKSLDDAKSYAKESGHEFSMRALENVENQAAQILQEAQSYPRSMVTPVPRKRSSSVAASSPRNNDSESLVSTSSVSNEMNGVAGEQHNGEDKSRR